MSSSWDRAGKFHPWFTAWLRFVPSLQGCQYCSVLLLSVELGTGVLPRAPANLQNLICCKLGEGKQPVTGRQRRKNRQPGRPKFFKIVLNVFLYFYLFLLRNFAVNTLCCLMSFNSFLVHGMPGRRKQPTLLH